MIAPLLRLAATSVAGRALRNAAAEALTRALLMLGAAVGAVVALICFSFAALTFLDRHMDPAEARAAIGGFYALLGVILYFAAARRRRG